MCKILTSKAKIVFAILGLFLEVVGFVASNADKDASYRRIAAPNYDSVIGAIQSLQVGKSLRKSDAEFKILEKLLQHENPSLNRLEIMEISKFGFNGFGLMSDGSTNKFSFFEIITEDGEIMKIPITNIQEKIDSYLLQAPMFRLAKLSFYLGIVLQIWAGLIWFCERKTQETLLRNRER